jgi:hypothetical protein
VLLLRAHTSSFDGVFVGAQGDVSHRLTKTVYTKQGER